MELCPRPSIIGKKKSGQREKLATTCDKALFDLLMAKYEEGYSISHIVDSALWQFFDRPELSFQKTDKAE